MADNAPLDGGNNSSNNNNNSEGGGSYDDRSMLKQVSRCLVALQLALCPGRLAPRRYPTVSNAINAPLPGEPNICYTRRP